MVREDARRTMLVETEIQRKAPRYAILIPWAAKGCQSKSSGRHSSSYQPWSQTLSCVLAHVCNCPGFLKEPHEVGATIFTSQIKEQGSERLKLTGTQLVNSEVTQTAHIWMILTSKGSHLDTSSLGLPGVLLLPTFSMSV